VKKTFLGYCKSTVKDYEQQAALIAICGPEGWICSNGGSVSNSGARNEFGLRGSKAKLPAATMPGDTEQITKQEYEAMAVWYCPHCLRKHHGKQQKREKVARPGPVAKKAKKAACSAGLAGLTASSVTSRKAPAASAAAEEARPLQVSPPLRQRMQQAPSTCELPSQQGEEPQERQHGTAVETVTDIGPCPPVEVLTPESTKKETHAHKLEKMKKILEKLMAHDDSADFNFPIEEYGFDQLFMRRYRDIVKHPRDLGTIKRNLENERYGSVQECAQDIRQVWENCKLANGQASSTGHRAKILRRFFEDLYRRIEPRDVFQREAVVKLEGEDDAPPIVEMCFEPQQQGYLMSQKWAAVNDSAAEEALTALTMALAQCRRAGVKAEQVNAAVAQDQELSDSAFTAE